MLTISDVTKTYVTGDLHQQALDHVSLRLRDSEFVAILGPSGSGKTTLLNIIGGLDRYDEGDLIINGISTKNYRNRDWDAYRNHRIGFVFQSYNLIPHQTIAANVELALTISGISRKERKKRALDALEQVGLSDQAHKRPNQLSGGQMQRVAIARALVNNPDILLADEPTGALDSDTSMVVMNLLKKVAQQRLVVMVTHNPELARIYATRIVTLKDGKIVADSRPLARHIQPAISSIQDAPTGTSHSALFHAATTPDHHSSVHIKKSRKRAYARPKNSGKTSMGFLTALALSFNNLRTKKARTILTAFAGSIGIIGISTILSLSNGVNTYITDIQKSTMASYPITIEAQALDLSGMLKQNPTGMATDSQARSSHHKDGVYSNSADAQMLSQVSTNVKKNNLSDFKKYLDNPSSPIHQYVGSNGITYTYDTQFNVYTHEPGGELINTDGSSFDHENASSDSMMGMMRQQSELSENFMGGSTSISFGSPTSLTANLFQEITPGSNGQPVSSAIKDAYRLVDGSWPQHAGETVLIANKNNEVSILTLYQLGLLPADDYRKMSDQIDQGEPISTDVHKLSYSNIYNHPFYLFPAAQSYEKQSETGIFADTSADVQHMEDQLDSAIKLSIVGVVRPNKDMKTPLMNGTIGYTQELTDQIISATDSSAVVTAQKDTPDTNVLTGLAFSPSTDEEKAQQTRTYMHRLGVSEKVALSRQIIGAGAQGNDPQLVAPFSSASDEEAAGIFDRYINDLDTATLLDLYDSYVPSGGSYDKNLEKFGVISREAPSAINIYADTFEAKDSINECIEDYNATVKSADAITYTDYVGLLMDSITTIINVISYVLIAFVAVSLIVSSIMIGIITYISVLERTKEIGILRAIGASQRNISQVFNAETFMIGLLAGLFGIVTTLGILVPVNAVIHALSGIETINAALPPLAGVILIGLSVALTMLGGLIPSHKAAQKDPVLALRSE